MAADQGNVVVDSRLGGGADRISDLPDHLLHRILICLPSTADAARTSVLSRRWHRVWTHLPELALRHCSPKRVDAALAAWSAPVLHRLEIVLSRESRRRHKTAERVCSWLRFASERLAGELCLSLRGLLHGDLMIVLPVCGRFTAISLAPGYSFCLRLRFQFQLRPAAGVFMTLAALTLKYVTMESCELEEVVSSRLKELVLDNIILELNPLFVLLAEEQHRRPLVHLLSGHQLATVRRGRLLQLAAAASALLLLVLLVLLPAAPPGDHTAAPASLLRAAVAAHPSPASYARPCADHLALSLHRLRAALSSLEESGDVPAALHLASGSLQCQLVTTVMTP